jgi:hypothetical protein
VVFHGVSRLFRVSQSQILQPAFSANEAMLCETTWQLSMLHKDAVFTILEVLISNKMVIRGF